MRQCAFFDRKFLPSEVGFVRFVLVVTTRGEFVIKVGWHFSFKLSCNSFHGSVGLLHRLLSEGSWFSEYL